MEWNERKWKKEYCIEWNEETKHDLKRRAAQKVWDKSEKETDIVKNDFAMRNA